MIEAAPQAIINLEGLILAVVQSEPSAPANVGLGAIVLILAVAALLTWMGYLWLNSRRTGRLEETPANLQPGLSDDELETSKLSRVLSAAVVSSAVLAVIMPLYYVNESNRQAQAAEKIHEQDIEEGERFFEFFSCINCHSPGAVGGGAPFTESRSNLNTSWAAPSLNDIFLRFSTDEIREIIVYGRLGTPMPPNGLAGGGAMTKQEVTQVIAYLEDIQIAQGEALDEVNGAVDAALSRMANAEGTINDLLAARRAEREDIDEAPGKFDIIKTFPDDIELLLQADGTCTRASANLVGRNCGEPGRDGDRDGLTDAAELALSEMAATMLASLTQRQEGTLAVVEDPAFDITFDRNDAFTNAGADGEPIADLDEADTLLNSIGAAHLTLSIIDERVELFREQSDAGIAYLEQALEERKWETDLTEVASATGLTAPEAERALGLFNAYCARCHTAGYNAGVAFQQEVGSGAWGPSLQNGRAVLQFPDEADHMSFIIKGSDFAVDYGINGLGTGRMPGFGRILSQEDIELILQFERAL